TSACGMGRWVAVGSGVGTSASSSRDSLLPEAISVDSLTCVASLRFWDLEFAERKTAAVSLAAGWILSSKQRVLLALVIPLCKRQRCVRPRGDAPAVAGSCRSYP